MKEFCYKLGICFKWNCLIFGAPLVLFIWTGLIQKTVLMVSCDWVGKGCKASYGSSMSTIEYLANLMSKEDSGGK